MAEGLLRRAMPDKLIRSAGIGALVGQPADPFSVQIMQEHGVNISDHRAQQLSARLVSEADLILTMDLEQKRVVEMQYVASKGKVFRLGEFGKYDIADPYRESIASFRAAHRLIADGVDALVTRIVHMA
jgi:protein-tyrosine phosphatase